MLSLVWLFLRYISYRFSTKYYKGFQSSVHVHVWLVHRRRFSFPALDCLCWVTLTNQRGAFQDLPNQKAQGGTDSPQDPGSSCLSLQFRSDSFLLSSVSTLINAGTWAWASKTMPSPVKLLYTDTDLPKFVFINLHLTLKTSLVPIHAKYLSFKIW